MELYDLMKNIYGKNNEEQLTESISIVKKPTKSFNRRKNV